MKTPILLLTLAALLAGCATTGQSGLGALRDEQYLRDERRLPMTFPQVQRALMQQRERCGSAPEFAMWPQQTNYASITQVPETGSTRGAILIDLAHTQTWSGERLVAKVYAKFSATDAEIARIFSIIHNPGQCAE